MLEPGPAARLQRLAFSVVEQGRGARRGVAMMPRVCIIFTLAVEATGGRLVLAQIRPLPARTCRGRAPGPDGRSKPPAHGEDLHQVAQLDPVEPSPAGIDGHACRR